MSASAPESSTSTGITGDELGNLDEVLELLDAAVEQARGLEATADEDDDTASPAGSSGSAEENRSIRHAHASLARGDAHRLSGELSTVRDRMREAVERARRSTTASRDRRAQRQAGEAGDGVETVSRTDLADALDRAARGLLERGEETLDHTLGLIVGGATRAIAGATRAGITLVERDGSITSHAPSDGVVAQLDALQSTLGEGPCRDAVFDRLPVVSHDLDDDARRWPRFAPEARSNGIASMLSFQLFGRDERTTGALNIYADSPRAFDEGAIEAGALFASHAALALHGARRTAQLNDALTSRDVIGQAKGILIERFGLTEDRAFAMLVSSSQDTNMKLRAVAEWVVGETTRKHGAAPA